LKRSFLLRVQYILIESLYHRAAAALALAANDMPSRRRSALLREVQADARSIQRERMQWSNPLAQLLQAAVSAARGNGEEAAAMLCSAEAGFDAAHMSLYAAAARRRRWWLRENGKESNRNTGWHRIATSCIGRLGGITRNRGASAAIGGSGWLRPHGLASVIREYR